MKKAGSTTLASNFMDDNYIIVPLEVSSLIDEFNNAFNDCETYLAKELEKNNRRTFFKQVPDVLVRYLQFIDSLQLETKTDADIVLSNNYFHLFGLTEHFFKLIHCIAKSVDYSLDQQYIDIIKKKRKVLKRLAALDFQNQFDPQKVSAYRDEINYFILSGNMLLQHVFCQRKDFIAGLKVSESNQEYMAKINDKKPEDILMAESMQLIFLSNLYLDVQDFKKSFALFKESMIVSSKYLFSKEVQSYGLSKNNDIPIVELVEELMSKALTAVQNKKLNLIAILVQEIPAFYKFVKEHDASSDRLKQVTSELVNHFYQQYLLFIKEHFNFKVDIKKRCLVFKNMSFDIKGILKKLSLKFLLNPKQKQLEVHDIHFCELSKLEALCNEIQEAENKLKLSKVTKIPTTKTETSDEPKNQNDVEEKPSQNIKKDIAPKNTNKPAIKIKKETKLKASDLGFRAKYDQYELFEIKKRGVSGVFYGFFKPAKKLRHGTEVTQEVLNNHKAILEKERVVGPEGQKGIKFVPLNRNFVGNYRQDLAQQQKSNDNNNQLPAENLTFKTGFTFKTKDPEHDLQFLAKVKQVVENEQSGKQKILYKFWQPIKHKEDVMSVLTSKLAL